MTKSKNDLVNRALTLLQKIGEGETPSEGDTALVEANVQPVVDQLAGENVLIVGSVDEIDDSIFLPLARILANESAPDFSQAYSDEIRATAIMQINRVMAVKVHAQPLATDYF